ncbi:MAG: OmpH family outer membrane protein [Desulfobulbaceae bacterium]|jgi:outer membrane protein|nr:OmpH family outer membrane protein [Desulfobulbaceae bacterium]
MTTKRNLIALIFFISFSVLNAHDSDGQQKTGYIDSEVIMNALPETQDAERKLESYTSAWQSEIMRRRTSLDSLFKDYQSKEILYTEELKKQKQQVIIDAEKTITQYQNQKFGSNGEYFKMQAELMKPIQTRIFNAMKKVAADEGYDFIFDKSGDILLLYTNEEYNLTQKVLDIVKIAVPGSRDKTTK